jgi:hypothetical protein
VITNHTLYQLSYSGLLSHGRRTSVVWFGHGPAEGSGILGLVEHPKTVGDRSTLAVMLALQAAGYNIALPFGENTRYDLLIDDGATISRVQCKSARFRGGSIWFKTSSSYAHHPKPKHRRSYRGEVDYFGVHCWETGGVYLVPVNDVPTTDGCLRVEPSRNGQEKGIRLAAPYEIARLHAWITSARASE